MLNRTSVRAGVAMLVILFSVALSNNALPKPFAEGDVITHSQSGWGDNPAGVNAAAVLRDNYENVYSPTSDVVEVGIPGAAGFSLLFTNRNSVLDYLPALGPIGPLSTDQVDPLFTASGAFGGEVLPLRINIDFSDAGVTLGNLGIPFGDLMLHNFSALPLLNGLTMRQFSAEVNSLLGGGSAVYSIDVINPVIEDLNRAFAGGAVTSFARDHVRVVSEPVSNYRFVTYTQANWGATLTPTNAAALLQANFNAVYASTAGLLEVGLPGPTSFSMTFNSPTSLRDYLPASGPDGKLNSDFANPLTTSSGGFGGEVVALKLNIDFADADITQTGNGIRFGDLNLQNLPQTQYDGLTVREFLDRANFELGANTFIHNIFDVNAIVEQLNAAFAGDVASAWARDHLWIAGIPGDYDANGIVDAADYVVWRKHLNKSLPLPGDMTPWMVTAADFNVWCADFGQTPGSGSVAGANVTVPEPATLVMMVFAAAGWCLRRGRTA